MNFKSTIGRIVTSISPVLARLAPGLSARLLARLFTTPLGKPVSKRDVERMAAANRTMVQFDDRRAIPIYSWGEGPVALLVHGWSGRASQLSLYAAPLVARGYKVVAFDAPAHGEADGRRSSLPELAAAVQHVAELVGPVTAILAHSLGSASTTLALSRGVSAQRVVYLAPPEDLPGYLARLAGSLGLPPETAARAQALLEGRFGVPFEEARGGYLAPSMTAPLLAFHDRDDREVPCAEGARLAERWDGARLIETRGLGHHRIVRDPAVVDAALDFLAEPLSQVRVERSA